MTLHGRVDPDLPLLVVALDEEALHLHLDLPVLITGVGKVNSAIAVATLLAEVRPASVINLGTAGALRPGLEGIHEIGTVTQHDFDDEALFALVGTHQSLPIELGAGLRLATGDRFVAGEALRERIAQHADLVDMEGYAVATACRAAGVPVRLVKLVSDDAGGHADTTWADTVEENTSNLASWAHHNLMT